MALLKLYHDIPRDGHIEDAVFEEMVSRFLAAQLAHPDDFGARDHRELINREMRAIIWRRRDHPALAMVRDDVPAGWDGPWIDFIHAYAEPRLDRASLDIFRRYAQTVDEAASAAPIRRFPV